MNKKIIVFIIILSFIIFPICRCDLIDEYSFTLENSQLSFNNLNNIYGVVFYGNNSYWNLTDVTLRLQRVGTTTSFYFRVAVCDFSNFTNFDTYIGCSSDIQANTISTGETNYNFEFLSPIETKPNSVYGIYLLYINGTIDSTHYIRIARDTVYSGENDYELASTRPQNVLYYFIYYTCYELYGNEIIIPEPTGEYTATDLQDYFLMGLLFSVIVAVLLFMIIGKKRRK